MEVLATAKVPHLEQNGRSVVLLSMRVIFGPRGTSCCAIARLCALPSPWRDQLSKNEFLVNRDSFERECGLWKRLERHLGRIFCFNASAAGNLACAKLLPPDRYHFPESHFLGPGSRVLPLPDGYQRKQRFLVDPVSESSFGCSKTNQEAC